MSVRDRLNTFLRESHWKDLQSLNPDQSLIGSGLIDSLAFFNLVLWVEQEIGTHIDLTQVDVRSELDTLDKIVSFIEKRIPV